VRHERNSSGGTTQCTAQGLSLAGETMPDEIKPRFSDSVAMDDLTQVFYEQRQNARIRVVEHPATQKTSSFTKP
jgi:hypothetical protein